MPKKLPRRFAPRHWFSWADPVSFSAGGFEKILLAIAIVLFALFITIPTVPYSVAVLPVLFVGSVYIILRKNRLVETREDALSLMGKPVGVWNSFMLLLMPLLRKRNSFLIFFVAKNRTDGI